MLTYNDLNTLNNQVYYVAPGYGKITYVSSSHPKKNERNTIKLGNKNYRIIKTKYDSGSFNSQYRGMAIAPISKKHPNGDRGQVTIASAGTNPTDGFDFMSAVAAKSDHGSNQVDAANEFLKNIQKHNNVILLTGYSQSGFMLKVGAGSKIPTVVFNGWFKYSTLSDSEREFMKKHPNMFVNLRHTDDIVVKWNDGNSADDDLGTIVWVDGSSHDLSSWNFNKDGSLKIPAENGFKLGLVELEMLHSSLKSGGLTDSEKIYLDAAEAITVSNSLSSVAEEGIDTIIKNYNDAVEKLEPLWQRTLTSAESIGQHLNQFEITDALERGGITHKIVVDDPTSVLEERISNAQTVKQNYIDLTDQIKKTVANIISTDTELSKIFSGV